MKKNKIVKYICLAFIIIVILSLWLSFRSEVKNDFHSFPYELNENESLSTLSLRSLESNKLLLDITLEDTKRVITNVHLTSFNINSGKNNLKIHSKQIALPFHSEWANGKGKYYFKDIEIYIPTNQSFYPFSSVQTNLQISFKDSDNNSFASKELILVDYLLNHTIEVNKQFKDPFTEQTKGKIAIDLKKGESGFSIVFKYLFAFRLLVGAVLIILFSGLIYITYTTIKSKTVELNQLIITITIFLGIPGLISYLKFDSNGVMNGVDVWIIMVIVWILILFFLQINKLAILRHTSNHKSKKNEIFR
ncbi:hypothetical protein EO244_00545 [Ancylomarina salipaludis]|uniref:Uncharacterized protein n=1 Tax=Ancylomarina salipaludis TaxID=2501299 RepID=A0A4Q1JR29_9BACT|nr:hypothetical protein [Ancylomarina salipaludis]RXQ97410.1 hypothetical protein EO244_00545 [Ancylomarina salipaludis]